jgi:hypothetical protein
LLTVPQRAEREQVLLQQHTNKPADGPCNHSGTAAVAMQKERQEATDVEADNRCVGMSRTAGTPQLRPRPAPLANAACSQHVAVQLLTCKGCRFPYRIARHSQAVPPPDRGGQRRPAALSLSTSSRAADLLLSTQPVCLAAKQYLTQCGELVLQCWSRKRVSGNPGSGAERGAVWRHAHKEDWSHVGPTDTGGLPKEVRKQVWHIVYCWVCGRAVS